jgi:KDO2-lipid IV(A) lauroyltransferase
MADGAQPAPPAPVPSGTRVFLAFAASVARMPLDRALAVGRGIGWVLGSVVRHRRAESADAIRRCLPGLRETEVATVLREMYANFGQSAMESLWLTPEALESYLRDRIEVHGREIVEAELARGHGALMLTAHAGNFDLIGRVARTLGFPLTIISKTVRSPAFEAFGRTVRDRFGIKVLPAHGSYRDCLRTLRRNEMLGFVLDQNMTRADGIFVDFFGRPACTTPGLAFLSGQSRASVIPIFIERLDGGRHAIRVMAPLPPPPDLKPESIRAATQAYSRITEDWIRAHPGQWIWIHRRWKTQPAAGEETGAPVTGSGAGPRRAGDHNQEQP